MRVKTAVLVVGALLWLSATAHAQWGWGPSYHASTAAESYQRGFADVVRSAGAANLMNSAAAKNVEDARAKYIDNRLQATKTYFEMKRINKDYRDANAPARPTSEQLHRLAKQQTPGELPPTDLDPVTGTIQWPDVLTTDVYAPYRDSLEALYADRAGAGGQVGFEQYQQIRKTVGEMQDELKGHINDMPPQVFSQANAFLKKLDYTATVAR